MYTTLMFDVEDFVWPGSDDIARDLALILTEEGLRGTFFVVGEKARALQKRQRSDVIAALQEHDIGLHSNMHSLHPTPSEYLEDKGWLDGVEEAVRREQPGIESLTAIFGERPCAWARPGASWGPQIAGAMRRLGVPAVVYSYTRLADANLHRFCGVRGFYGWFGGFDHAYSDDDRFEQVLGEFARAVEEAKAKGLDWLGTFCCHPTTVRAEKFWDAINFNKGENTPPEEWVMPPVRPIEVYPKALANFRRLARWIRDESGVEVRTISELTASAAAPPTSVSVSELSRIAARVCAEHHPLVNESISPAEQSLAFARALLASKDSAMPERVAVQFCEGPVERPSASAPTARISREVLLSAAESLLKECEATGCLPADVQAGNITMPLNCLYGAAAKAIAETQDDVLPSHVVLPPVDFLPPIAEDIAAEIEQAMPGWMHKPDLDVSRIAECTRLQTWTMSR